MPEPDRASGTDEVRGRPLLHRRLALRGITLADDGRPIPRICAPRARARRAL